MTGPAPCPGDPLDIRVRALEAESLARVPRATHAVAVDVDDVALVNAYAADAALCASRGRPAPPLTAETASALGRLETAVRVSAA